MLSVLLRPGETIFSRLTYKNKFLVVSSILLIPAVILALSIFKETYANYLFTKQEMTGVNFLEPLGQIILLIENHNGLVVMSKTNTDVRIKQSLEQVENQLGVALQRLDRQNKQYGEELGVQAQFASLREHLNKVIGESTAFGVAASEQAHHQLILELQAFNRTVADKSNLTLDSAINTYYLMDMLVNRIPDFGSRIAIISNIASQSYNDDIAADMSLQARFFDQLDELNKTYENIETDVHAVSAYPIHQPIAVSFAQLGQIKADYEQLIQSVMLNPEDKLSQMDFMAQVLQHSHSIGEQLAKLTPLLESELQARERKLLADAVGLAVILALSFVVSAYMFMAIYLNIQHGVTASLDTIRKIAQGDLSVVPQVSTRDEIAEVLKGAADLQHTLTDILAALQRIAESHRKGEIDAVIDHREFKGVFSEVAQGINATVQGHIAVNRKAMAVVTAFSHGDFDQPLETFPGKQRFINDGIEGLRSNIKNFNAEMQRMAEHHQLGQVDTHLTQENFAGEYRLMAEGVNGMVQLHKDITSKILDCVRDFGKGDFETPLEPFPGQLVVINERIEKVRSSMKSVIKSVNWVTSEHAKGNIDQLLHHERFSGDYGRIMKSINDMVQTHIEVSSQVLACMQQFGEGNFEAGIPQFPGQQAAINHTVELIRANLKALASDTDMLASAAAEGRVTLRADTSRHHGDFRRIVEVVNSTLEMIVDPIARVKASAETINTAAQEIARGNIDLSQRTEEQASSLEETASSMEELASTVKQNAAHAQQANQLAQAASGIATRGGTSCLMLSVP